MNPKPRVVFDTNIFVSGIIYGGSPLACIDLAREGKVEHFTSNNIILELAIKLREKFDWEDIRISRVVHNISTYSHIVNPKFNVDVIKSDPTDNRVLEVAKEAGADYIVTGDKRHVLPIKKFGKTNIVTAAQFLKTVDIKN